MMALLSFALETWQSVHCLVAVLAADGVRHVGAEGDAAQALGRDRLLLDVDRLAVLVVRADVDGARRPGRADAVAGHVAVAGQHVDVVAQRLEVVRRCSCGSRRRRCAAAASSCWPSAAGGSRSSSGSTTSGRRCSSCCSLAWARHLRRPSGRSPQTSLSLVEAHRLGQGRLRVVARVARGDGVDRLRRLPSADPCLDHRILDRSCRRARSKRRLPNGVRMRGQVAALPSGDEV